jgi:hypothetical protein
VVLSPLICSHAHLCWTQHIYSSHIHKGSTRNRQTEGQIWFNIFSLVKMKKFLQNLKVCTSANQAWLSLNKHGVWYILWMLYTALLKHPPIHLPNYPSITFGQLTIYNTSSKLSNSFSIFVNNCNNHVKAKIYKT